MGVTLIIVSSPLQARHAGHYVAQMAIAPSACVVAFVKSRNAQDNAMTRRALAAASFSAVREFAPLLPAGRVPVTRAGEAHEEALREYAEFRDRSAFADAVRAFLETLPQDVDRIVIGDYRPVSFRQFLSGFDLASTEVVLLDDGAVSQSVMAFRESLQNVPEVFRVAPFKGKFVAAADPLTYPDPPRLTFFTIYSGRLADGDAIIANTAYDTFLDRATIETRDEVWIAGCSHVESKIAKAADYSALCAKARAIFADKPLVYLPHRREDAAKVEAVAALLGAQVRRTEGIETHIETTRVAPTVFVSFGSTALDTLPRMLRDRTAFWLIAPPASYFRGERQDHLRQVIRANLNNNERVAGVFATDPNAARRREAARTLTAPPDLSPAGGLGPSPTFGEPDLLEGLEGRAEPDGSTLYLETPTRGLHRLEWGASEIAPRALHTRSLRIAGEGRSAVRLRMVQEAHHVDCDLDLDQDATAVAADGPLAMTATTSIDARRRAVVRTLFSSDAPGPVSFQLILRPAVDAQSSYMLGNPSIGVSLLAMPPVDPRGAAVKPDFGPMVVQLAADRNEISTLRLAAAGAEFDVVLHATAVDQRAVVEGKPLPWAAGWTALSFAPRRQADFLRASTPAVLTLAKGLLSIATNRSRAQIRLPAGAEDVMLRWFDPYTGERRIVEMSVGTPRRNVNDCCCVAY